MTEWSLQRESDPRHILGKDVCHHNNLETGSSGRSRTLNDRINSATLYH